MCKSSVCKVYVCQSGSSRLNGLFCRQTTNVGMYKHTHTVAQWETFC